MRLLPGLVALIGSTLHRRLGRFLAGADRALTIGG
jgi:hypothetical protein